MDSKKIKRYAVLGILFFLPVTFLLLLYPAKHNYNTLDIIGKEVKELTQFSPEDDSPVKLEDHLTVLGFFGYQPLELLTGASNLKELIYDKFKGFKTFQIVILLPESARTDAAELKRELMKYEELKFWHFTFGSPQDIQEVYSSLNSPNPLGEDLATDFVFIIDKERNLRGRLDDRSDNELAKQSSVYEKRSYDIIKVADLKNKMSEDVRILFTEYRQKRKGNFDSSSRRENELKGNHE